MALLAFMVSACIALGGSIPAPAGASGFPPYEGMSFAPIYGPADPEEISWEVSLGEEQKLELVNDQLAQVRYTEGGHTAFSISAAAAHDATGASVPTSLALSEGNVITLIVHHRSGNPAAGGAPFVYPIIAGQGWEGGFKTQIVLMSPPEEQEHAADEGQGALGNPQGTCLVPRLKGRSLRASRTMLRDAKCPIASVRKLKGATGKVGKVVKQSPRPGVVLAPGTTVVVTLGVPRDRY